MYIQYLGFRVAAGCRIYDFHVVDAPNETREFTVRIQSEAVRPLSLKFQDGPGICFARLKRELEGETPESRLRPHLRIDEKDVQEYMERQNSRKKPRPAFLPR